jgi:proteasome accessory factor B
MAQPKAARWLDLLAFLLQHRFPVTREQIYEAVADYRAGAGGDATAREAVRRKFERDKDELRDLGVDIQTVENKESPGDKDAVGYRLRERDFYLPYLEFRSPGPPAPARPSGPYPGLFRIALTASDATLLDRATTRVAAHRGTLLGDAALSARRKLAFDVPLPIGEVERLLAHPLAGEASKALDVLQRAVAERTAVACAYYAIGRDVETERTIEPYGLFFNWGRWYCVARCRLREALRVFRVDRMRRARLLTDAGARFTVPAGFTVRGYVRRAPWELSERPAERVVVRFRFPESRWVQAEGLGEVVDPLLDDGGARVAFAVRDRGPFLRWLLTFRAGLVVEEPAWAARDLKALRQQVAQLYAGAVA